MYSRNAHMEHVRSLSDKDLIDTFAEACSAGNEYDNRSAIETLRAELLHRLAKRKK